MSGDFTTDQKRYLEGFVSGAQASRGFPRAGAAAPAKPVPSGPDAPHLAAQDATVARGKKLVDQEKWKREEHPFDAYARLKAQADRDEFPKPPDNFRWRYYGLFYVAPNQDAYMCRLRIPNGVLTHWQFSGVADLAQRFGGGYAHATTRANLQIREIAARDAVDLLEGLQDLGLTARGSGADNIRNVTGDATAGIAPDELLDTRPFAREWHHHILNERVLYGLPRKFNVAFDGGGPIPTLEDTNDIGFQAVRVGEGAGVAPGVWFRLVLGGISGHRDLARDTGVLVAPKDATRVADAILRVYIGEGDRTNRNTSRLKYVLDRYAQDGRGFEGFLTRVEGELGRTLPRVDAAHVVARAPYDRHGHIGPRPQRQRGLNYLGVALHLGRMSVAQMKALALVAREFGDGDIRLTVWQNLLISGIPDAKLTKAMARVEAAGLAVAASALQAGAVACTGSVGCRFAAADTKGAAQAIVDWCEPRVPVPADQPINIHVTGCHNSCAQHYIGDIGLIGARVPINEDGDTVDGFHVVVGGGFGDKGAIGREVFRDVRATEAPVTVEAMLRAWLAHRVAGEDFATFANRHDTQALRGLFQEDAA